MQTTLRRTGHLWQSEVPEHLSRCFAFDSQVVKWDDVRKKRAVWINRCCLKCNQVSCVRVVQIRQSILQNNLTGMCRSCVAREKWKNQPRGEKSVHWKGGRRIDEAGYIRIRLPDHPNSNNGYILEHRVVMEAHIGRLLARCETVHHKNGIKTDNRIENLELWSKNHSDGQRYDDLSDSQILEMIGRLQAILAKRTPA